MISLQGPGWGDPLGLSDVKFLFHAGLELKKCQAPTISTGSIQDSGEKSTRLAQKFHFNLAPPPSFLDEITTGPKCVSLTDFIEQRDWEYSDLDIVDRSFFG